MLIEAISVPRRDREPVVGTKNLSVGNATAYVVAKLGPSHRFVQDAVLSDPERHETVLAELGALRDERPGAQATSPGWRRETSPTRRSRRIERQFEPPSDFNSVRAHASLRAL